MNELIPVSVQVIGRESVNAVSARDLHEHLAVKTKFKDWIDRRIGEYEFVDGADFCSFLRESSGGRPSTEYAITLDMAKELAMVEKTAKGKEARRYFIQVEKWAIKHQKKKAEISWQQARLEGKDARRHETDVIQAFVDYATAQGSKSAKMYFMSITKMTYKALGFISLGLPKSSGMREMLDAMQLSFLTTAEYVTASALREGMEQGMFYKDIYVFAKERVEGLGRSVPSQGRLEA